MKWDPAKYVQFGDYRDRPFFDLTARIHAGSPAARRGPRLRSREPDRHARGPLAAARGRGPGFVRRKCWPHPADHAAAAAQSVLRPGGHRRTGCRPRDTDVVVTNAALQWVPGHRELLARWLDALKPGAWFALQVPGNFNAPSHTLMRGAGGVRGLGGPARRGAPPRRRGGGAGRNIWRSCSTPAVTRTPGRPRTSSCSRAPTPFWSGSAAPDSGRSSRPSPTTEASEFEAEYSARLDEAYPAGRHGTVFPFRRIFAVAASGNDPRPPPAVTWPAAA